jgi:hypothetical protein
MPISVPPSSLRTILRLIGKWSKMAPWIDAAVPAAGAAPTQHIAAPLDHGGCADRGSMYVPAGGRKSNA